MKKTWGVTNLPAWDPDELYRLFQIHFAYGRDPQTARPPTEIERNQFAQQTMILIAIRFSVRNHPQALVIAGGDPDNEAQSLLCFFCDPKNVARYVLRGSGYKVLLAMWFTTIDRRICDAIEKAKRNHAVEISRLSKNALSAFDMMPAHPDVRDAELVQRVVESEQAVTEIIKGIGDEVAAREAAVLIRKSIFDRTPFTYADLPEPHRSGLDAVAFAQIRARTVRVIERVCGELGALAG